MHFDYTYFLHPVVKIFLSIFFCLFLSIELDIVAPATQISPIPSCPFDSLSCNSTCRVYLSFYQWWQSEYRLFVSRDYLFIQ